MVNRGLGSTSNLGARAITLTPTLPSTLPSTLTLTPTLTLTLARCTARRLESHYKSTVFEHAVVYAILVPTAGGGEIYVGATTSWPRRLHEHLNGQGSRALYALVEHVEKEEREAFVSAAILLDLAADVGDMPAFLDAVLGECGGHTHHTVDSVRFLIHHFEAIGLEELFLDDELSKLARLNRNPGAFGHLITCYAEANGARSTAIGADGRAGTASRGGHGMACEDRGALGTAIGADGRAGTGSRGGHGMACEDRGALGGALGTAIGADGRAGTGSRGGLTGWRARIAAPSVPPLVPTDARGRARAVVTGWRARIAGGHAQNARRSR